MMASFDPPENRRDVGPLWERKRPRPDFPGNFKPEPEFPFIEGTVKPTVESKRYPPVRISKTVSINCGVPSEYIKRNVDSDFKDVVVFKRSGVAIKGDIEERKYPPPRNLKGFPVCHDFPRGCTSHSASTGSGSSKQIHNEESSSGVNVDSLRSPDECGKAYVVVSEEKGSKEDKQNGCREVVVASQQSGVCIDTIKVTLKRYWEVVAKIKKSGVANGIGRNAYSAAVEILRKQQKCVNITPREGPVSGIEVGDMFQCRGELYVIGLHRQLSRGIDSMKVVGRSIAISVVASSRYDNDMRFTDVLIYSGEGGNPRVKSKKPVDQKLTRGNLALKNSIGAKNSVRVIRCYNMSKPSIQGLKKVYVYDGLYSVEECKQERGQFGKLVFKFTLKRLSGQPELAQDGASKRRYTESF